MDGKTAHPCQAQGCTVRCHPQHLMCRDHWSLVPKDLQIRLIRHWRNEGPKSVAWAFAAREAIVAVEKAEAARVHNPV